MVNVDHIKILLPLLFTFSSLNLLAQTRYSVAGESVDTTLNLKLQNTSISLLNEKDSTLCSFTRSTADGKFSLTPKVPGKYILLVTYPGYVDYVEHFELDSTHRDKNFSRINLIQKATLLKDVLIRGKAAAIKIKGDTTEFNAGSYTIQPNSKVEDLLRQLPGLQIDKDGKITAQGQTVNKVLIDGEEFFGDDPTLVTKNIRADMVDKVQLYDKKSDQATFTGVDDGQKSKTLNIKLKEDKKNGSFGNIDAGIGSNKFYEAQGMVNIFRGKKKYSAYSSVGNTGRAGMGMPGNSGAGFDGTGIPNTKSAGFHYESKWNKDNESINANYEIGSIAVDGLKGLISQNNLPDSAIVSNSNQNFHNYTFRQKVEATYEVKLDTTSNLKVSLDGTAKNNETKTDYVSNSIIGNNTILNDNTRTVSNTGTQRIFDGTVFFTKKLKKIGRTYSLSFNESVNDNNNKGFLRSTSKFYSQGLVDSTQIVDQFKTLKSKSSVFNSNMTYSEPISKSFAMILNYRFGLSNSMANGISYNKDQSGAYNLLDTAYSNNFKLNQLSNELGAMLNYKYKKSVLNFGTKVSQVSFKQLDQISNSKFERKFINWNPQAFYQYKFSNQQGLYINYNGNSAQPTIEQIQPLRNNTDPLNVTLGNPNLRPSFNNRIGLSYNAYKVLSNQSLYLSAAYGFTKRAIVSNVSTDVVGKSSYRFINLSGKNPWNYYFNAGFNREFKPLEGNIGLSLGSSGNTFFNLVNGQLNQTNANSYTGYLNLSSYKEKKFNMNISAGPTYSTNQSSLQKQLNDNGWGLNADGYFSVYLPARFEISSTGSYQYKQATKSFDEDFSRMIWNASVTKRFFKSEDLKFSLSVNDLLNQNRGFNRTASGNMIVQNTFTSIQRYFMLSLIWDFNKMGESANK
jgi:hypothetical protein